MLIDIRTKDLRIKPLSETDRVIMGAMLTNGQIRKTYMIPELTTQEAVDRLFRRFLELSRTQGRYVAGIYLGDRLIGFLNDVENDGRRIELGYVIEPAFQGKGYGTQMLVAVISDLFCRGYNEVIAGAFEENIASIRVMIKAGMRKLHREEDIEYLGQSHHCVYYAAQKQENSRDG